ncbi:MAG: acyl-CoA thioesterase [Planctomycetes bacterium]|nr:acyl-CoA thioesterase [Planctomycetota bacterium]
MRGKEVDALRVVWHGHYLTYFEEGRTAFGREYSLGYEQILAAGCVAPLVRVEVDFLAPATYGDLLSVRTRMHAASGARLDFSYLITDGAGRSLAAGSSVQVFTELDGTLVLTRPPFFERFLAENAGRMRAG